MRTLVLVILIAGLIAAGPATQPAIRPDLTAIDLAGHALPLLEAKHRATVLLFIGTDCPVSNGYVPEINRLAAAYAARGIDFITVYSGTGITQSAAAKHTEDFSIACPGVLDQNCSIANAVGATVTPEVAVLKEDGSLQYRGRIDDKVVAFGKQKIAVHEHDLADVLDAMANGKTLEPRITRAVGCAIVEPEK